MGLSLEMFVKGPKTWLHKCDAQNWFYCQPSDQLITDERASRWQSSHWDHRQGSLHCLEFISRTFSFFSWYLNEHFSIVDWISQCGLIYCSLLHLTQLLSKCTCFSSAQRVEVGDPVSWPLILYYSLCCTVGWKMSAVKTPDWALKHVKAPGVQMYGCALETI